ncbi:flagellar hook-length control protein FliK [Paenibacillus whitsoniae]|uniref:Flagellar hook-length control protein FliK n=1 Tax=Paenibacillus whitsoniae TaxID=2496558 RepID=A0A430J4A1_9BACL|nr:flagellar hook-length control protein FliK [Paenibacillus whitsoniae]RTE01780.1 flagellar hook-length control protein FliK [Paenibacillus whitsoniae]
MEMPMMIVPGAGQPSSNGGSAAKGTAKGAASNEAFAQILGGAQGATVADGTNASDTQLSMSMMLQMLQSLISPVQGSTTPVPAEDAANKEQQLPELLVEAMHSNPAIAQTLLQYPKVKAWFEQAEDLLSALGNSQQDALAALPFNLTQSSVNVDSLKAQNTLLTLSSMMQQNLQNPIIQHLNQELTAAIQPILPEIMAALKPATDPALPVSLANEAEATAVPAAKETDKKSTVPVGRALHSKHLGSNRGTETAASTVASIASQAGAQKSEPFALRHVPLAGTSAEQAASTEPTLPLVDFPLDDQPVVSPTMTVGELQKQQQAPATADKAQLPVIHAANFTEEMASHVLKNMKITMTDGFSEAKLSLFPKNLGHIDVKISMHEGQVIAQFAADTLAGKQMLESQLPQLRQALQTQGLQVEKIEVTQSPNMSSSMFQDQRQPQSFQQSQQRNKHKSEGYETDSVEFNPEMEQVAEVRTQLQGNSFNATA